MNGSSKYLEQLARVNRWYQRFERIDKGIPHELPTENYLDEIFAFFLNCYHLKDWIIHDENTGVDAVKVEDFITNNEEMRICADICNSIKHLKLRDKTRSGQKPEFRQRDYDFKLGGEQKILSMKCSIDTSIGTVDAFDFAKKCLQAWEGFIDEYLNDETTA